MTMKQKSVKKVNVWGSYLPLHLHVLLSPVDDVLQLFTSMFMIKEHIRVFGGCEETIKTIVFWSL